MGNLTPSTVSYSPLFLTSMTFCVFRPKFAGKKVFEILPFVFLNNENDPETDVAVYVLT